LDNIEEDLHFFYKHSQGYRTQLETHQEEYFRVYLRNIQNHIGPNNKILDLGCGTGFSSFLISQRNPTSSTFGLDISYENLKPAVKNLSLAGVIGDAKRLPFGDNTFDVVTSY